jgi:hypothetical protein
MPYAELRNKYTKMSSPDQAKAGWTEDFTISSDQVRGTIAIQFLVFPGIERSDWQAMLSLFTVPARTKVQNGVELHDRQKSAGGAYLGRPNSTRVGNGWEGSLQTGLLFTHSL